MDEYREIRVTLEARVVTIRLHRPDRLNAWTPRMAEELRDAIGQAGRDPACRCIVITGAGRGFCAGADMAGLQVTLARGAVTGGRAALYPDDVTFPDAPGPDPQPDYPGRFGYLFACPKPIIAAINGPCAGIGLAMALYADLRFAAEDAGIATAFAQRGLIAEHGMAWLLPHLVGEARALDLLLTGRKITGAEAAQLGLVNAAFAPAALMPQVAEVARRLAWDVSPRSIAVMKRQVRMAAVQSFAQSLALADAEMQASFAAPDFHEGVQSFVEKRAAEFPPL